LMTKTKQESSSQPSIKRAPQRTCVACRQVKDKQELIRLVRTPENSVEVDIKGKMAGRGAYLCRTRQCWEFGFKGGRLEHTLKTKITQDNRDRLIEFGKAFLTQSGE